MPHVFTDLQTVTDEVHALFDGWADTEPFASALGEDGMAVLRLAVHEWVANLVQHARFPDGVRVALAVGVEGDGVRCVIEDSSVGFDLAGQIEHQKSVLDAPAPSERGRGLLMLITSTNDLAYRPAGDGVAQRISFQVRDPGEDFFAVLFRPEDLATDPTFAESMDGSSMDGSSMDAPHTGDGQTGDALPHPSAPHADR